MGTIRHFFRHRPALAALLLAAALCLKALVPTGYMPTASETGTVVMLCSGTTMTVNIPVKGTHQDHGATTADHPCAFAPLGAAMTGADFAVLALAALAFVFVAAILRRDLALPTVAARIRPPGQAPPLFI
ncbi:hypothetical protein [Novosphingobium guangzhouense]|uniref:DUF2946 domain-containing protein n=1 Tax=Novosphingobium guangzhouense TaxID=1850347 RepID=A0A2K2FZL7_9SPHN|nr:hypothetical protein [Novosphingobium guangzhouense]PNU04231.1 hypothetical protein A8V01_21550 [Novosphingobium guangzhouense]